MQTRHCLKCLLICVLMISFPPGLNVKDLDSEENGKFVSCRQVMTVKLSRTGEPFPL